jgi:hypothetical protein
MAVNWHAVAQRLTTPGPNGQPLPAITGQESDADLREMILQMSGACPLNHSCLHCPFRILQGLSYSSLNKIVDSLDRASCLELFNLEQACRSDPEGHCPPKKLPPE